MAVAKDKVLAAIESKFKGKSITKTYKESLATKWAAKIENDDDIEKYIEDREDDVLEAAAEADRRATDATKKAAEKKEETKKEDDNKADELPADTPEWAKALLKKNADLEAKFSGFEKSQTQKTIAERFKSDERVKGIPEFMFKGRIPATEDEFETAVSELAADFDTYAKENNVQRFVNDTPGAGTGGKGTGVAPKVDNDLASFAKQQNETFINEKK